MRHFTIIASEIFISLQIFSMDMLILWIPKCLVPTSDTKEGSLIMALIQVSQILFENEDIYFTTDIFHGYVNPLDTKVFGTHIGHQGGELAQPL